MSYSATLSLPANRAAFAYDPTRGYVSTTTLDPGEGAWVKAQAGETVTLLPPLVPSPPTITSLSPSSGPTEGGNPVVIAGTAFVGVTEVAFGDTEVLTDDYTVDSDTRITVASAPGHSAGPVRVSVTTAAGTTSDTPCRRL